VLSNADVALIGAAAGSLCTGVGGFVLWQVRRPIERRDALIQKKMNDRWDASVSLKSSLAELNHAYRYIVRDDADYLEGARRHRKRARECARASVPLLGEAVNGAVIDYTDVCEEVFALVEDADVADSNIDRRVHDAQEATYRAIEEALKSLPRE
jgi:hypothetical protein